MESMVRVASRVAPAALPAACPAVAPAAAASAIFRSTLAARLWKGISDAGGVSRYSRGPAAEALSPLIYSSRVIVSSDVFSLYANPGESGEQIPIRL